MVCNDTRITGEEPRLIYAITLPFSTVIILANLLMIVGIAGSRQLHNPPNYIYLSLLVADLCLGVALPFIPWMNIGRPLGYTSCLVVHVAPNFLFLGFVFNLVLVHYERYMSIVNPLLCGHFWLHRRFVLVLLVTWLLPLLFALLPAFGWNNRDGQSRIGSCCSAGNGSNQSSCDLAAPVGANSCCTFRNVFSDTYIYLEVYGLLVPAIVSIAGMTVQVLWIAHRQLREIQQLQRAVASAEWQRRLELRYARCVGTISLAFLACWLPYIIYTHMCMLFLLKPGTQANFTTQTSLLCAGVGGMAAVPLLLGLTNREYTEPARRLMGNVWHRWCRT